MTTTDGKLPEIKTAVPGPKSKEICNTEQRYIAPGRQRISLLAGLAFDHGEGATLTDADGNTYVDFFAGVAVASLGHGHPGLAQALAHQASRLMVGTFATRERAEAFKLLSEVAQAADFFFLDRLPPYDATLLIPQKGDFSMARAALSRAREILSAIEFTHAALDAALRAGAAELKIKAGQMFQPIRVAVCGRKEAPPLFETLEVLGRETCLKRIDRALEMLPA